MSCSVPVPVFVSIYETTIGLSLLPKSSSKPCICHRKSQKVADHRSLTTTPSSSCPLPRAIRPLGQRVAAHPARAAATPASPASPAEVDTDNAARVDTAGLEEGDKGVEDVEAEGYGYVVIGD
jgi:hypothetical protein